MATPALSTVVFCACLLTIVAGMEMDWTSYSDRADLPMSQKWREDMKDKLSSVDTAKLTPEQKRKFKELWRRVNGDPQPAGESVPLAGVAAVALLLGAGAYMWLTKPQSHIKEHSVSAGTARPPADPARSAELRELRMRRFAEQPVSTGQ
ncbi:unnamed protein product [Symbiodinium sp. CCMP2456]|nr:unnamed protein product [Symbiodinium sp. CCMP2456]